MQASPDKGLVSIADFAPYRPSYAAPAAFVATPIYDAERLVGILALQRPQHALFADETSTWDSVPEGVQVAS